MSDSTAPSIWAEEEMAGMAVGVLRRLRSNAQLITAIISPASSRDKGPLARAPSLNTRLFVSLGCGRTWK